MILASPKSLTASLTAAIATVALAAIAAGGQKPTTQSTELFETKIRPLLAEHCFSCHGPEKQLGGLRLDVHDSALKGGNGGAVIVPGDVEASRLIRAVRYNALPKMPPAGKLTPEQIASLEAWVKMGAPWPESAVPARPATGGFTITPEQRKFWAFQSVRRPAVPALWAPIQGRDPRYSFRLDDDEIRDRLFCRNPIDNFILAKLKASNLKPAPEADRRTLIRRATFDLTGLPPTPNEIDDFLKDTAPNAYEKLIDRLLASPAYGEKWARHWLDVVRYTDSMDSRGSGAEGDCIDAWKYRDWVVDALNRDLPYDQFIAYQVAGDLLPNTQHPTPKTVPTYLQGAIGDINAEGVIATTMLNIGNWGNGDADKDKILTDIADDQLDVVSRAFMGLTVACARCHDHKFDPISTKDYYGLAGIFFSTHILPKLTPKGAGETLLRIPLISAAEMDRRNRVAVQIAELEKKLAAARQTAYAEQAKSMLPITGEYVLAAWEYENRGDGLASITVDQFARQRNLRPYALRQWVGALTGGDLATMSMPIRDLLGNPGVYGWKGPGDTPSMLVNTTDSAKMILTFTLPPKSLSVHPGPTTPVVISWRSPISGVVRLEGKASDADPACGDGVGWAIEHRRSSVIEQLASGAFENGGSQDFNSGTGAENLKTIAVKPGEVIRLVILPKNGHACDTTSIVLKITEAAGKTWDVTRDLLNEPTRSNPHPDSLGNPDVWSFAEMTGSGGGAIPGEILKKWEASLKQLDEAHFKEQSDYRKAAEEFGKAYGISDSRSPFWIRDPADDSNLPESARTEIGRIATELDSLRKTPMPQLVYANGAQDGGVPESPHAGVHDVRVHIRGRYDRLGDMVPRRFPLILAGENQPAIKQGSGRLELARWLGSAGHPLTSRVIVNRLWQHHFGEGIVRTPSNFGKLGERPSHPELLDWLASELVLSGWSLKHIHKLIMRSSTYRQSSTARPETLAKDPDNRLFGRMNRHRLEAEGIRDNLLAVSDELDPTLGGPAIRDRSTKRRALYVITIRSDRTGFGPLFDTADSTNIVAQRTVSTVAPQALYMMNNPFIIERTKGLASRILKESAADDSSRIRLAYVLLYGRPATEAEIKIGEGFLDRARKQPSERIAGAVVPDTELRAWTQYCQVLLCANEFIYVD